MKKFLALLLALVMVFALAACGDDSGSVATDAPTATDDPAASSTPDGTASIPEDFKVGSPRISRSVSSSCTMRTPPTTSTSSTLPTPPLRSWA